MNSSTIAFAFAAVVAVGVGFSSYVSAKNFGNRSEVQLDAKLADNENVLASGYQQLRGVSQVTSMYRDDTAKVFRDAITGRYGEDGSKAVFQMIKEQNPTVDASLYAKVQQVVVATQKEFQTSQTQMLQQKATYQVALGSFWQGMWLSAAGYPRVDLAKYKMVSTGGAAEAFKTGKQNDLNLR